MAICASCGEDRELCGSLRENGVQQPRLCTACLIKSMRTNDDIVNPLYWMAQLYEAKDMKSIEAIKAVN